MTTGWSDDRIGSGWDPAGPVTTSPGAVGTDAPGDPEVFAGDTGGTRWPDPWAPPSREPARFPDDRMEVAAPWLASPWAQEHAPPAPRPRRKRAVVTLLFLVVILGTLLGVRPGAHAPDGSPPDESDSPRSGPRAPGQAGADPGSFAFLDERSHGQPVAFSSCRAIEYVVRPDNAPPGGQAMLDSALQEVSGATGLQFHFAGWTDEPADMDREAEQPRRYGPGAAPVLMAWASPEEVSVLEGDVVGYAGPTTFEVGGRNPRYESGVVYLDAEEIAQMVRDEGSRWGRAVILHELGHLVGLDHVDDDTQLMYPEVGNQTEYGKGDLAGLAALGEGTCFTD